MNWPETLAFAAIGIASFAVDSAAANELVERFSAAEKVATDSPQCKKIVPFYWEIGDQQTRLVGQAVGGGPDASTAMPVASASKLIFGAYAVQKKQGNLSPADIEALSMRTGYNSLKYSKCVRLLASRRNSQTVGECFESGKNSEYTAENKGKFYYNGGHFQKYASLDLNLKDKNNDSLAAEMLQTLGNVFSFSFGSPQPAGGVNTSAAEYAKFLRAILSNKLMIGSLLGSHAVCTNPEFCATAVSTPIPKLRQWSYSLGHWVENDPQSGDGAFSSPGAFGFYPWIDAGKHYYGIIARQEKSKQAALKSVECGALIRAAFLTGLVPK